MTRTQWRTTLLACLAAVLAAGCLSPTLPTATPAATRGVQLPTAIPTAPPTATPKPSPTPNVPTLALPAEFAEARAAQVAQIQAAQPGLRIERVADSAAALARVSTRSVHWAISTGAQPSATARLLCLTPYVAIVHFSSPLDEMSAARLRAVFQGKDWAGGVYYSGDSALLRRILGIDSLGPQVTALASWKAVLDRVAGDRTGLAFVPWSEVDARVKALSIEGRSIAANGMAGYGIGDAWWLSAAGGAPSALGDALASALACPAKEPVTFLAGGDMLMGWFVNDIYIKKEGPEYPFRRIRDLIRSADISFGNFENPISPGPSEGYLRFRASPEAVKGLTFAGIDVVNLANNHMGDYGTQALLDTLDTLRQNGIAYVGAGRNRTEARSAWITTTKGVRIAVLAYNDIGIEPGYFAATDGRPGTAWIEPENVYAEIKKAKTQADFVIVSFHWGVEYTADPNSRQQEVARRSAEAGAGLIVGHHPHVVQGVGFFGNVFVDYSIGDFVYSQPSRPATGEGIILRAVIEGQALKQVQMIPIYIDRAQPYVISPLEAKLMTARIFDATSAYKGLPASTERTPAAAGSAALPQAATAAPSGSLACTVINGLQADLVLWSATNPSSPSTVTNDGSLNDAPAFSPDGKRIAYSSARDGSVDIFVAAADGAGAVNISRNPAWDDYPAWSPDGTKLAFSSNRDGGYKIYVMNADGSAVRRLTTGADWATTPAWSPDGKRIAFASDRSGTFQIYTMSADGGDVRQLANNPRLDAFPSWSPDGTRIAYQSYQDESYAPDDDSIQDRDYEIMVISAGGGASRRLTNNVHADVHPAWSPDGKRIAFASDRSGTFQIYTMSADGGDVKAVTSGPAAYLAPAWAP